MDIVYSEEYFNIINRAKERGLTKRKAEEQRIYVEIHHIIPKSIAPELRYERNNMVCLLPEEHYMVHKILATDNSECDALNRAWFMMCSKTASSLHKREYDVSAEDYGEARRRFSEIRRRQLMTPEAKEKLSKRMIDYYSIPENREKQSGDKNPAKRPEVKQTMSEKRRQRKVQPMTGKHNPNGGRKKHPIYTEEHPEIVFSSIKEAEVIALDYGWTGVFHSAIVKCLKGKRNSCGKDNDGNKLHWKPYIEGGNNNV